MPKPRKQTPVTSDKNNERIAQRLIALRKSRGFTQAQLAEAIGISRNLLANYELGRTRLTDESIILVAKALNVSADKLLGLSSEDEGGMSIPSVRLVRRMQRISQLSQPDQKNILRTIDIYLKGVESGA